MAPADKTESAEIQYMGVPGSTQDCLDAIFRLIQFGDVISTARILTYSNRHGFLLAINVGDLVAVKSGFTSGYGGEGPSGFSYVLQLLRTHGAEITEHDIGEDLLGRLDNSALLGSDLALIDKSPPVLPSRWYDYIRDRDWDRSANGTQWERFPPIIPYALVDPRIADLALGFWQSPDENLLKGYRRLEDVVRRRTGLSGQGQKLFAEAFNGKNARLTWAQGDEASRIGKANLFSAAYMANRNPRVHTEPSEFTGNHLAEFLLLNHLFALEADASDVPE